MKKYKYVRATLTLKPTDDAAATMRKKKASITGPLTGTLAIISWIRRPSPQLVVAGSLEDEPKTSLTKPKKAKVQRARKR
jgi:hypothetical protein